MKTYLLFGACLIRNLLRKLSLMYSPSRFLGPGRAGARLNLMKGSRLTKGGRLGFRGCGPSRGGRGRLRGITSPALLWRGWFRSGWGVEGAAGEGTGLGIGLLLWCLWCIIIILFCSISPVCFTLLLSGGWTSPRYAGLGGRRGGTAVLREGDGVISSALGNLVIPCPVIWNAGDSLCCTGSFSDTGRMALPGRGRGDLGEPLSRLLLSEVLVLLLNLALRALTSTLSSCNDTRGQAQLLQLCAWSRKLAAQQGMPPTHANTHKWECTVQRLGFLVVSKNYWISTQEGNFSRESWKLKSEQFPSVIWFINIPNHRLVMEINLLPYVGCLI